MNFLTFDGSTVAGVVSSGLEVIGTVLTFVTDKPLLLSGVIIGIGGYALAVGKNAIR